MGIHAMIALALLARICLNYPENHWGYDIRWLSRWCITVVLLCACLWLGCRASRRWLLGAMAATALLGGLVVALDRYNLLLEYELWIGRGMPCPGR
jgi:hypothetical protein